MSRFTSRRALRLSSLTVIVSASLVTGSLAIASVASDAPVAPVVVSSFNVRSPALFTVIVPLLEAVPMTMLPSLLFVVVAWT